MRRVPRLTAGNLLAYPAQFLPLGLRQLAGRGSSGRLITSCHPRHTFKGQLLFRVEASTAKGVWIHLTTIFNAAVDDKRILKSPCKQFRTVKAPRRNRKKAKAWRRATVDAVQAGLQERYHLAVDVGLGAGLRQGETFGLAEEDFDFEAGVVHIRRQLRWDAKARPYFCLPKGQKTRTAPLSPNLALRAREYFRRSPSTECTLPWRNPRGSRDTVGSPTAETRDGEPRPHHFPRQPDQVQHLERALVEARAGLCRPDQDRRREGEEHGQRARKHPVYEVSREDMYHVLRHTYASVQLEAGESIVSLAEWLGHSSPKVTLDHYAHFMPEAGRRGLAAMDSWLAPNRRGRPLGNVLGAQRVSSDMRRHIRRIRGLEDSNVGEGFGTDGV